jgi:hypothetical protein
MITGSKNILGIPAAQRQSRERQQRRRQPQRQPASDSDEKKSTSDNATIIKINARAKQAADAAIDPAKRIAQRQSPEKRKLKHVDVRV